MRERPHALAAQLLTGRLQRQQDRPKVKPSRVQHVVYRDGILATEPDQGADGFVMPDRALLVLRCLKLVTFLGVWIVLGWSVWRLLS
jgi:hypothetical protein